MAFGVSQAKRHWKSEQLSVNTWVKNRNKTDLMNSGQADGQTTSVSNELISHAKSVHDVRASLAITRGFNQALETSFSELFIIYEQLLASTRPQSAHETVLIRKIEALEGECRFCLSRVNQCMEKLSADIETDTQINLYADDLEQ